MLESKFVENFALQFDETDPELITLDSKFKDLEEWSSLNALSIMAMADEEYGVRITGDDISAAETLKDLFEIIKSRM